MNGIVTMATVSRVSSKFVCFPLSVSHIRSYIVLHIRCGISVMNPEEIDKSPWKCFIGIIDESGELKTVGAIVDGTDPTQIQSQGYICS